MKRGRKLEAGDTIGVIALASSCEPKRLNDGLKRLESLGFKTKVALDPCKAYGKDTFLFSSDTPQNRAKALQDLFCDPSIKAIIAARGAYGSIEILPYLDMKAISANPKCLVGFSDITAILLAITQRASLTAIHGPMVSGAFADPDAGEPENITINTLIKLLKGEIINPFQGLKFKTIKIGKAQKGPIIGGSLTILVSLLATPWQVDLKGSILFLEDTGVKPFRIHRMLLQLKQAGQLSNLAGVILGDFSKCDHPTGPTIEAVFIDMFKDYDYPVLSGLSSGHGKHNLSVPLGVKAQVDGDEIKIFDSVVELS